MLKKLRIKFVAINMCLVGSVLLLVFIVVGINIYNQEKGEVDRALDMALSDVAEDRAAPGEIGVPPEYDAGRKPKQKMEKGLDVKALNYSAVVALVTEEGAEQQVMILRARNVSMSQDTAEKAVNIAVKADKDKGRISEMDLFYMRKRTSTGIEVAFADASYFDAAVNGSILKMLIMFILGMAALFFVSVLLSRIAVSPVKKAWEQQRRFVADASHELKTPLTVILANNEILLTDSQADTEKQKKWIESSQQEAYHMKSLIDDLLFLARSDEDDEGRMLIKDKMLLSDIVMEVSLQFEPVMYEAGVLMNTDIQESIYIECDGTRIKQLVHILLDNAVKYTEDSGRILVQLEGSANQAVLRVANTGEPVSDEDMEHIFERFYRADKARTQGSGFGLGLSIARTIAESHGGQITAGSGMLGNMGLSSKWELPDAAEGTVIKVVLPALTE